MSFYRNTYARRAAAIIVAGGLAVLAMTGCGVSGSTATAAGPSEKTAVLDEKAPLFDLLPQKVKDKGVLTVATQPDFEPANFTPAGETGIQGYNVDLMESMAKQLGIPVKWEKVPFDQILIGMQSGKFDAAIAGMTDRKKRQEQVDFIDYQWAGTVFMVQKGNPKGITSAVDGGCGVKIGDVKGSDAHRLVDLMAAACTAIGKPATELISFPNSSDKNLALTSGRIDAIFWPDMAVSVIQRETGDKLESLPVDFEEKVYLGMTFNKAQTDLRDAFLTALKAIHEDGSYDGILKKWHVEVIDLDTPGINLAKK
ncbi:ABC transporter substrate-binding protein [Arthrobacter sp. AK01]|uniref:ABC transporter substrate-binding protein n=1 Tax=Micrococcaceae TaxID=1268 RepID=UPI001E2DF397|nr:MULTISPECIES: ABC transporter substrate-binding protein [Micrococcaceae]MCD4849465.1 ABC transporter substrate-binding protein [Arthrobacter sp. AK01]MCP1410964.1 polar amino acid transport system substrate-binding protein [Paenarthrobacter sp. A20]